MHDARVLKFVIDMISADRMMMGSDMPFPIGDIEPMRIVAEAGLKPDQVMPFILQQGKLALYLHGTTTAYTSAIGNPGARVLAARFDQRVNQIPDPIDEKMAAAMAAYARQTVDYFKAHGVRVVNMSWRVTEPQIDCANTSQTWSLVRAPTVKLVVAVPMV